MPNSGKEVGPSLQIEGPNSGLSGKKSKVKLDKKCPSEGCSKFSVWFPYNN